MFEILVYGSVFVLVGGIFYFLDQKHGVKMYSTWWKWTHKEPLPEGEVLGFISGRRTAERVVPAILIAVIISTLLRLLGEHDFIILLLKAVFLMLPGILAGFALAGLVRKHPKFSPTVEAAMSAVDRFEAGEVNLKDVARGVASEAVALSGRAVDAVKEVASGQKSGHAETTAKTPPQEGATEVKKPARKNFSEALKDYSKRS